MQRPPDTFQTARLSLRRPAASDADALFAAYAGDPEVTRFMSWQPHADAASVRRFLADVMLPAEAAGTQHDWVIERDALRGADRRGARLTGADRRGARPIGMVSAMPSQHGVEIGYVLGRAHWGNGYMAEAVAPVVAWLEDQPDVFRVWAYCDVDNVASARVLEKAGFEHEGLLRRWAVHPSIGQEPRDALMFSRVR